MGLCMCEFCNVWVCVGGCMCGCVYVMYGICCVGVCMCGFCNVWVYVWVLLRVGVRMCGFCNVWVFLQLCGCFGNVYLYLLCFRIFSFMYIYSYLLVV